MTVSRSRRDDRGAAAVEFALVLPILILLLFGIVDFGRMLAAKITITEAAREGVRAAALIGADEGVDRVFAATTDLNGTVDPPEVIGCPEVPGPDDDATVTVTYQFEFITPISLMVGLGGDDGRVELSATGVMACL